MNRMPTADARTAQRAKVPAICRRLNREYGPVRLSGRLPPLDELIATILSQNTTDSNSDAAFRELRRRFPDWDAVRRAPTRKIVAAIRCGGLAAQKATFIKAALERIVAERGELSLEFLKHMTVPAAMAYLRSFSGVGPKTAACVLLFACDMPVLPVDTHVHRVSRRLELIGPRDSAEKSHELLALAVPARRVLEFHLQVIRHGRQVCVARNPRCKECILLDLCPAGRTLALQHSGPGLH